MDSLRRTYIPLEALQDKLANRCRTSPLSSYLATFLSIVVRSDQAFRKPPLSLAIAGGIMSWLGIPALMVVLWNIGPTSCSWRYQ